MKYTEFTEENVKIMLDLLGSIPGWKISHHNLESWHAFFDLEEILDNRFPEDPNDDKQFYYLEFGTFYGNEEIAFGAHYPLGAHTIIVDELIPNNPYENVMMVLIAADDYINNKLTDQYFE